MGNAPYEITVSGTDDETFSFSLPWENADGTEFPFEDYAIEYALNGDSGRSVLRLTVDDGLTVSEDVVTFQSPNGRLPCGRYTHGCRVRHLTTSNEFQVFDGSVVIAEGGF